MVDELIPSLIIITLSISLLLVFSTGIGEAATGNNGEEAFNKIIDRVNQLCESRQDIAVFYVSLPESHSIKIYDGTAGEAPDIELRKDGSEQESTAFEDCGGDSRDGADLILEERSISNSGEFTAQIVEVEEGDENRIEIGR